MHAAQPTCCWSALLVAKDQVDPVVQAGADSGCLQRSPVHGQEAGGGAVGPRGQHHVAHRLPILPNAQRQRLEVLQEVRLWKVELWDELLW